MKGNRFTDRIENPLGKPRKKSEKKIVNLYFCFFFSIFVSFVFSFIGNQICCMFCGGLCSSKSIGYGNCYFYIYILHICSIHTYLHMVEIPMPGRMALMFWGIASSGWNWVGHDPHGVCATCGTPHSNTNTLLTQNKNKKKPSQSDLCLIHAFSFGFLLFRIEFSPYFSTCIKLNQLLVLYLLSFLIIILNILGQPFLSFQFQRETPVCVCETNIANKQVYGKLYGRKLLWFSTLHKLV